MPGKWSRLCSSLALATVSTGAWLLVRGRTLFPALGLSGTSYGISPVMRLKLHFDLRTFEWLPLP